MAKKLLRIHLQSIMVLSNGDPATEKEKKKKGKKKNNALVATLVYPRSGAHSVVSSKLFDLENEKELTFDLDDFWESGLFKEEVEGETILKIEVTDRDKISSFDKLFRTVAKAIMGAGFGAITGTISNVVLGAIVKIPLAAHGKSFEIDKDEKIDVIGKAELKINLNNMENNPIELPLIVPKTIVEESYQYEAEDSTKIHKYRDPLLKEGQDNGSIKLHINAYDV